MGCFTWLGWPPLNNLRTLFRPDRRQFVFSFSAPAGWVWVVLSSEQFQFIYKVLCKIVGRSLAVCVLQPGNVWYQFAPAERSRESWAVTRWRSLQLEIFHIRSGSCYLHTSLCTLSHPQSNYWDKGCHQAAIIVLFCFEIFLGIDRHRPAMCYISTERPGLPGVTRANPTATTQRAIIWTGGRCEAESDSSIHCPLMCLVTPTDPVWAPSQERITNRRTVIPTLGFTDYPQTLETLSC